MHFKTKKENKKPRSFFKKITDFSSTGSVFIAKPMDGRTNNSIPTLSNDSPASTLVVYFFDKRKGGEVSPGAEM